MPILIKGISANILDNFIDEVVLLQSLSGEIGSGDYVNINGITAFLQDYSKVEEVTEYPQLNNYGLKTNSQFIELNISY